MIDRLFDPTMQLLEKILDLRAFRHSLIATNIAHQDTPGYQAKDASFHGIFQKTIPEMNPKAILARTDSQHFTGDRNIMDPIQFALFSPHRSSSSLDGNTVDIEKEMASMAENTIHYNAAAQILTKKFTALVRAIREGGG